MLTIHPFGFRRKSPEAALRHGLLSDRLELMGLNRVAEGE